MHGKQTSLTVKRGGQLIQGWFRGYVLYVHVGIHHTIFLYKYHQDWYSFGICFSIPVLYTSCTISCNLVFIASFTLLSSQSVSHSNDSLTFQNVCIKTWTGALCFVCACQSTFVPFNEQKVCGTLTFSCTELFQKL